MEFIKNFGLTAKEIVLRPNNFFSEITWDGGWKDPLVFFAVCAGLYSLFLSTTLTIVVNWISSLDPAIASELRSMGSGLYFFIAFVTMFVGALFGSLLISFCTTIALHLLGGTGTFQRTYTVLSCCWIVMLITWIPFVGWLAGLYFFYMAVAGLTRAHNVPAWKALTGLFLGPGTILLFIGGVLVAMTFASVVAGVNGERSMFRESADPGMREIMNRYAKKEGSEDEKSYLDLRREADSQESSK